MVCPIENLKTIAKNKYINISILRLNFTDIEENEFTYGLFAK